MLPDAGDREELQGVARQVDVRPVSDDRGSVTIGADQHHPAEGRPGPDQPRRARGRHRRRRPAQRGAEAAEDRDHGPEVCRIDRRHGPVGGQTATSATMRVRARHHPAVPRPRHPSERFDPLAKTPRTWTGARTPSGLKRVRQAERRRDILQPRRSAAKTYVANALSVATHGADPRGRRDGSRRRPRGPRSRGEDRRDPRERGRAPQVAPDPEVQRRDRWRRRPDLGSRREDDVEGPGREGGQGPDRGRQGQQGKGRPDGGRQGPRGGLEDGSCRGGRRGDGDRRRGDRDAEGDDREGRGQGGDEEGAGQGDATAKAPPPKATAKKAPAKKAAAKS